MSEEDLSSLFNQLSVEPPSYQAVAMNEEQLQAIIQSAVTAALQAQQEFVERRFSELQLAAAQERQSVPVVGSHTPTVIDPSVHCDIGLDAVKSVPEFTGNKSDYLTFRQAAEDAYKVFEGSVGSVKHHQALSIIRNKIRGPASDNLTGFGTPLNFSAIIKRLDAEFGDKRPIHLIEQEMSTLRQGSLSVTEYYGKVQIKLTALTNKTIMTYSDPEFVARLNDKYRQDALRVFISGLKRSLSDTLFSSRPEDLPSALALAEELEGNRERYNFASSFHSGGEVKERSYKSENKPVQKETPHFVPVARPYRPPQPTPEPMDVDASMRTALSKGIKPGGFSRRDRQGQGVNNIAIDAATYEADANTAYQDLCCGGEESEGEEIINFLGQGPCSRS